MDDFLFVRVSQGRQKIRHDAEGLGQREHFALVQVVLEVIALNKLQHQKSNVTVPVRVIHTDDVGVLKPRCRMRFGSESHFVFVSRLVRQAIDLDGFNGNPAIQVWIAPLIDQSHGAFAEHANQIITTKFYKAHE